MKFFTIALFLLIFSFLLMIVYPFYNPDNAKERTRNLAITVSIYPIYDIVKEIGQDKIYLKQIIPFGTEPHSFEPTPKDMMEIGNSQLFIFNGLLDNWAKTIANNFPREKSNINLSKFVTIKNNDPHYWLDFDNLKTMVKIITKKIIELDKKNSDFYLINSEKLLKKIENLDLAFKEKLQNCTFNQIIVNHNAFRYLANKYNFKTIPIMGLSPDEQPSAKKIAEILNLTKNKQISTIFFEELANDEVVRSISKDAKLQIDVLSPLGNIPPEKVKIGFIELMKINLNKLAKGLNCQQ